MPFLAREAAADARICAAAATLTLLAVQLLAFASPQLTLFRDPGDYLLPHLLLELFSVVVSLLVFGVGWNTFDPHQARVQLTLACGFLAVALIDGMHALSFQGMPRMITESSAEKAILFWLAARSMMALTLLAVAARITWIADRWLLLALALGSAALVAWLGVCHQDLFPRTFAPGSGLTPFKVYYEYALVGAYALCAALFLRRTTAEPLRSDLWWLACACAVMGLSEVFFTRYRAVSDAFNVLGHLYKCIAFFIIYRVVYVTGVKAPFIQVRAFEQKFRASFDHAFQGMHLLDLEGCILELNQSALRALGLPRAAMIGRPLWLSAGPEHAGGQAARVEAAVKRAASGEHATLEVQFAPAGSRPRYADLSIKPFRDEHGTIRMLIAEAREVTEQRERAAALALSETRLQQAVGVADLGIFEHDHLHDRIYWSDTQYHIYGWPPRSEVTLDAVVACLALDERPATVEAIARAHDPDGDGVFRAEQRIHRPDGQTRWINIRSQTFFDGSGAARRPIRTVGAVNDITERKLAEEALLRLNATLEQRVEERTRALEHALRSLQTTQDELVRSEKLAALGALVAGVAHELNTPLGNALMVASTLRDKSANVEHEARTGALKRSTLDDYLKMNVHAANLVMHNLTQAADLVANFKQVAVDQTSAKRREFDLKEVIEEVMSTVQFLTRKRMINVHLDLVAGLRMDSYPGPLGQVLNNFINNALDHAFAGMSGGEITLRTQAAGDGQVLLEFCDNGSGIDPAHIPRLFDPFFTTRLGQGGSGLGLNIVHNMVTGVLGGSIAVRSAPGRGSCFLVTLPQIAPRHAEPAAD